jgi:hypothetical protein
LVALPLFVTAPLVAGTFVLAALSSTVNPWFAPSPNTAPTAGELATKPTAAAGMKATISDRTEVRLAMEGF